MHLNEQTINQALRELPDNVSHAIRSFDWGSEITRIAQNHRLQVDDIGVFRNETLAIMLGRESSQEYHDNLVKKLGIDSETADSLIHEANMRIFSELQKRAFSQAHSEPKESPEENDDLDFVAHEDLANEMKNEGIELIDNDSSSPLDSPLHREVKGILGENTLAMDSSTALADDLAPKETTESSLYHEPIEAKDLRGPKNQHIDTTILKKSSQFNPEKVLAESNFPSLARDLGQPKSKTQSLDQHLMDNPFIAKGDRTTISPSHPDVVSREKNFLEHLSAEEE